MADVGFTGYPLCSQYWDTPASMEAHGEYVFQGNIILNQAISYQGFFKSGNTGVTPDKWGPVYTTNFVGQISCNLGDPEWLGASAVPIGSSVVFVFWETLAGSDRTAPAVLHGRRGWFERSVYPGQDYTIYPVVALTDIVETYSDNMPTRYGDLDYDYTFNYSSIINETYECVPFVWCLSVSPYTCEYTPSTITMSHEATKYGEQMFATISGIRETLTFQPDGGYIQRTQSSGVTTFEHSFSTYQRSMLIRSLEYNVDGVWYEDTLYPDVWRQTQIIENFFVELVIGTPGIYDINLFRDRDFSIKINTDRVDFWTFKAQIKESFGSPTILAEFDIDVNFDDEYLEISLDADTVNSLVDEAVFDLSSVTSKKTLVWDLKIVNPVYRTYSLVRGNCYVNGTITRT